MPFDVRAKKLAYLRNEEILCVAGEVVGRILRAFFVSVYQVVKI